MLLAAAIFVVTLALVVWQPRGLGVGWSAMGGAAVALATGVVGLSDIATVWHIVWDATFTFVALIVISLVLDEAGCFEWAARCVARAAGGRGPWLFLLLVLLGAAVAAVFANDGAALLLTPIVAAILLRLGFEPPAALAFIIATGFIADTASLPLVISNLVNILSANYFDLSFGDYAAVMIPVDLVSLVATCVMLWLVFGRRIPARYPIAQLEAPAEAILDRAVFLASGPVLALLLVAYIGLAPFGIPFSIVTITGALALMAIAGRWWRAGRGATIALKPVLRAAPWQIVWFSIGMYLVVYGLGQAGLTDAAARILSGLATQRPVIATVGTGLLAAGAASIMNNLPATLIGALAVDHATASDATRQLMIYANVIGNDLGPKLTPIGSLATLLWLHVLAGKGHRIGWGQYMKVGLILTPPVLLATLLALALWLPIVRGH